MLVLEIAATIAYCASPIMWSLLMIDNKVNGYVGVIAMVTCMVVPLALLGEIPT